MSSAVGAIKKTTKTVTAYKLNVSNRAYRALVIAVFAAASIFLVVALSAYTANLQHSINMLQKENTCLEAEIDSLNSQIIEETKVTSVEKIATEKLGMVHPDSENCINVKKNTENSKENLAATIKGEAYN